ncbi:MAG: amidase, partial [Marinilabiliales bacterium]
VSANLTVLAIGTETNGSIVCPSNNNGIVGIKPTVGLLSRSGIIPISFTQDTPGPMARNLTDAVICLNTICGVDSLDSKTLAAKGNTKPDYTKYLKKNGLEGKRIGVYTDANGINFKVDKVYSEAIDKIKSLGAEVFEIGSLENAEVDNNSFKVMLFEYKDGLNNYFESLGEDAVIKNLQDLIDFNNTDSIEMKYYNQKYLEMALKMGDLNSDDYKQALKNAKEGSQKNGIDRVMDSLSLDAIIAPTGGPAWQTDLINGDNYQLGSSSPAAISGYPSITVPMGFIEDLPVGISFFGRAWSEGVLIEVAFAYENATKYRRSPNYLIK